MSTDPTTLKVGDRIRHRDGGEWTIAERKAGDDAHPLPGWWLTRVDIDCGRSGLADRAWESGDWEVVEPGPDTAMVLSELEWRLLADICECYAGQAGAEHAAPEHLALARRIIEAARA